MILARLKVQWNLHGPPINLRYSKMLIILLHVKPQTTAAGNYTATPPKKTTDMSVEINWPQTVPTECRKSVTSFDWSVEPV